MADFGLTKCLTDRQYYSLKDSKAKMPVKWMALESLEEFNFSAKSDVVREECSTPGFHGELHRFSHLLCIETID